MTKKYLVPWSGGIDSTMVLMQCLETSVPGNVRAISFDLKQISARQRKFEVKARDSLKKWMDKTHGYRFSHQTVKVDGYPFIGDCPQPVAWIGLTAACTKEGEQAVFGWLKTDYGSSTIYNLRQAWTFLACVNGGDQNLWLPFMDKSKAYVQQQAADRNFLHHCWYCEGPGEGLQAKSNRPCGTCECCMSFKAGEMERELRWGNSSPRQLTDKPVTKKKSKDKKKSKKKTKGKK